jgi:transglutaminase/protease-like cytokinesis protein 3
MVKDFPEPAEILKSGKTHHIGFAILYKELCKRLGVRCSLVTGFKKGDCPIWHQGLNQHNHAWNIIRVLGQLYIVDPYSGAN